MNVSALYPALGDIAYLTSPLWAKGIAEESARAYAKELTGLDGIVKEVQNVSVDLSLSMANDGIELFRGNGIIVHNAFEVHTDYDIFSYNLPLRIGFPAGNYLRFDNLAYGMYQSGISIRSDLNNFNNYFWNYLYFMR